MGFLWTRVFPVLIIETTEHCAHMAGVTLPFLKHLLTQRQHQIESNYYSFLTVLQFRLLPDVLVKNSFSKWESMEQCHYCAIKALKMNIQIVIRFRLDQSVQQQYIGIKFPYTGERLSNLVVIGSSISHNYFSRVVNLITFSFGKFKCLLVSCKTG